MRVSFPRSPSRKNGDKTSYRSNKENETDNGVKKENVSDPIQLLLTYYDDSASGNESNLKQNQEHQVLYLIKTLLFCEYLK